MSTERGVYVVFDEPRGDRQGPPVEYRYGPYLVADFNGDTLTVTDLNSRDEMFITLARLGPEGWEVNDGMGTDRAPYRRVRFVAADSKAMIDAFAERLEDD